MHVPLPLPSYIATQIWYKACEFSSDDICTAPGTDSCWVVKSDCGKPFIIEKTASHKFICDHQRCMMYKSSNICAHTVAVAKLTNNIL